MAWTLPKTYVAGEEFAAAIANAQIRDNQLELRAGGIAISGQAANDFIFAESATQLGRLAGQTNKIPWFDVQAGTYRMISPLEAAWPIGSIFKANVSTNPATLIGVGTWTAFGTGRCLICLDSGDAELDGVREMVGEKTVTLLETHLPSHNHTQNSHNHTQNAHDHSVTNCNNVIECGGDGIFVMDNSGTITSDTPKVAVNNNTTATNQNTGGGGAHNNLMPYIVAYVWERTG